MKSLAGSLLATLLGTAMLVVGIAGVAGVFDDDDDDASASTTTATTTTIPEIVTPSRPDRCAAAAERDIRLGSLDDVRLKSRGDETGSAEIRPVCNGSTVVMSVRLTGVRNKKPTSYFVWLYRDRRKADQIGSLIGSDGTGFGSATIEPDVDTEKYEQIVITRVKFGVGEKRPRKIVFSGSL